MSYDKQEIEDWFKYLYRAMKYEPIRDNINRDDFAASLCIRPKPHDGPCNGFFNNCRDRESDKYPHKCPRCGSPAYIGFSKVECSKC